MGGAGEAGRGREREKKEDFKYENNVQTESIIRINKLKD